MRRFVPVFSLHRETQQFLKCFRLLLNLQSNRVTCLGPFGGSPLLQQAGLDFRPAKEHSLLEWALAAGFFESQRQSA
jgi:hypothetical protein